MLKAVIFLQLYQIEDDNTKLSQLRVWIKLEVLPLGEKDINVFSELEIRDCVYPKKQSANEFRNVMTLNNPPRNLKYTKQFNG